MISRSKRILPEHEKECGLSLDLVSYFNVKENNADAVYAGKRSAAMGTDMQALSLTENISVRKTSGTWIDVAMIL